MNDIGMLEVTNLSLDEPCLKIVFFIDDGECVIGERNGASTNDDATIECVNYN